MTTANSPLDTLIDLTTKDVEKAAQNLGAAIKSGEEAQQKLALLLQYRDDYAIRAQSGCIAGINAMDYRNFQAFLSKLDSAISGQQEIARMAQNHITERKVTWQECERKRMSYGTLADRAKKEKTRTELRRDQKMMDEHAARRTLHNK